MNFPKTQYDHWKTRQPDDPLVDPLPEVEQLLRRYRNLACARSAVALSERDAVVYRIVGYVEELCDELREMRR